MKNKAQLFKFSILLFVLVSSHSIFSQEINLKKNQLENILVGKWEIDSIIVNGQKASLPEIVKNSGMEFRNDQTFSEIPVTEKSQKGNWVYNIENHRVELFVEKRLIGTIRSVDQEKLVYLPFLNEEALRFIKSSVMYLKPIE